MSRSRIVVLAIAAIAIATVLVMFFRGHAFDGFKAPDGEAVSSGISSLKGEARTGEQGKIDSPQQGSDLAARSIESRGARRGEVAMPRRLADAIADRDVAWVMLKLFASSDPDDWSRAAALGVMCATAKADIPASNFSSETANAFRNVLVETKNRCGEAASGLVPGLVGSIKRAREANGTIARLPHLGSNTRKVIEEGLESLEAERLSLALKDPKVADEWIVLNQQALVSALLRNRETYGFSESETIGMFYLSLCKMQNSCSEFGLYNLALCSQSFGSVCGEAPIEAVIRTSMPEERFNAVRTASTTWIQRVTAGDVAALGIKTKR